MSNWLIRILAQDTGLIKILHNLDFLLALRYAAQQPPSEEEEALRSNKERKKVECETEKVGGV